MSFKISPRISESFKLSPRLSDSFRNLQERSNSMKEMMKGAVPCLKSTEAQVLEDEEYDENQRAPVFWQGGAAGRYGGEGPDTPKDEDDFGALGNLQSMQSMPSTAPQTLPKLSSVFLTDPGDFLKCEVRNVSFDRDRHDSSLYMDWVIHMHILFICFFFKKKRPAFGIFPYRSQPSSCLRC